MGIALPLVEETEWEIIMTIATYIQSKPMRVGDAKLLCDSEALGLMRRKSVDLIRCVAFLVNAPLVGLLFVIVLPAIGLAALLLMACEALRGRRAGCARESSATTGSSTGTEDTMTNATEFENAPVQGGTTGNPVTPVTNAVVASVAVGGGAMFLVSSFIYSALLSTLE